MFIYKIPQTGNNPKAQWVNCSAFCTMKYCQQYENKTATCNSIDETCRYNNVSENYLQEMELKAKG
jgi:hypothetical protein